MTIEARRRAAQARLKAANEEFAQARWLVRTGDDAARERADQALRMAREARAELASLDALAGVQRGRARR